MRPLAMSERGVAESAVSVASLFAGEAEIGGTSDVPLEGYVEEILRSGFPGIRDLPGRARRLQLSGYLSRIIEHDLHLNGIRVRRPEVMMAWLAAYGAATATTASYTSILDAATGTEADKPVRQTVAAYREHLVRLFVLDPVPAWSTAFSPLRTLALAPKHHLVDPALAAELAGIGADGLLAGRSPTGRPASGTWLGALFESLVTQSVRVYAEAMGARVAHLRSKDTSHEIDLIVETRERRVLAIEVKLSGRVEDKDVRHLTWLKGALGERLADRVVVTTGTFAYRRRDGVAVVPLALLGP